MEKPVTGDEPTAASPIYRKDGRALGVVFKDLTVLGVASGVNGIMTLPAIVSKVVQWPVKAIQHATGKHSTPTSKLIRDVSGVIFPGESMLVLGRPGAGCTTLLKTLANSHGSFVEVQGQLQYAALSKEEMARRYRSETVYASEEDFHFPTLSVKNTMSFAFQLRKPATEARSDSEFAHQMTEASLKAVGLSHTANTIVGNSFVRGVSGGERKRVTLIEALSVNPTFAAWDNPTRGLDSSSATEFVQLITSLAAQSGMSNAVSMYQVSETIYECFDRVTVLYGGRLIFCGRAERAKDYFLRLGFECRDRQTIPDFLTAVTSPAERLILKDAAGPVPTDPDGLAAAFRESAEYRQLQEDIVRYQAEVASDGQRVQAFRDDVHQIRSSWVPRQAIAPSTLAKQIWVAMRRYYQLLWGDKWTFLTLVAFVALNAVINGPAYYKAPKDVTGTYEKSSALFFSLIYFYLNALTEAVSTVKSRNILFKQVQYGFIHPSAFVIAQTLADIPIAFFQCLLFACLYYFEIGLQQTASTFWIFVLLIFTHYAAVQSLFRMLGAWVPNISLTLMMAGSAIPVGLLYSGFGPTRPTQRRWGSWLRRASPSPYALEALLANELDGITLTCAASDMVPSGSNYTQLQYQTCSITGSVMGQESVPGSVYLADHFGYTRSHLWRNFGIVLVMWFLYVVLGCIGLTIMTRESGGSHGRIFKRFKQRDEENQPKSTASSSGSSGSSSATQSVTEPAASHALEKVETDPPRKVARTFTFKEVSYFVPVAGKERQLLRDVSGYARPGQLTALMGASGAGKTTLLDTLAQRKNTGRITGAMRLGGAPLDPSFARSCGFVMQQDVHEPNATVREALQFSARLRQPAEVAEEDKLAYVEHIIHLLDLEDIADALIGEPGDGQLSVEERKRVTIGVELAARPSSLLFLDEPTSGLDSQAAFALVQFLQRIAAEGIPIVCTIHQPSGVLFDMFDHVLLLAPGGQTVYFGETGENSSKVVEYFGRYGATIDSQANPAEFILSTVTSKGEGSKDWPAIWRESPERNALDATLGQLNAAPTTTMPPHLPIHSSTSTSSQAAYALSLWSQTVSVTQRHWLSVWRDGMYLFSKTAKSLFVSLFIAFSFFHAGSSLQGLQNQMIAVLLLSWIIPTTSADLQDMWFRKWAIFTAREQNGIYDWRALVTALVAVEIPWQLGIYTVVFLGTYWTVGFPAGVSAIAGLYYFTWLLLALFSIGYSQLLAACFPDPTLAGYANSLIWVILMVCSGVLTPHAYMNDFYRPWLFWVDPMRYFFGATVGVVLHDVPVHCGVSDLVRFEPPPGLTCGQYAGPSGSGGGRLYLDQNPGYLVNPNATADCGYCPYMVGDDYLATLEYGYDQRWWNWAAFLGFCCSNFVLLYGVVWLTKGRGQRRTTKG
ncbi:ABC transporter-like protein [Aspergillus japonicus CBS 114.51]|uniref:ABC transporter-like protein n=1 Tax=Aspergillus japonicus CBS 114.51 TaxID=1448312 RepID=A0A8T8XAU8_ASPJA|nr:ABC transporter-like protein [Aspergillus japonicus CBS 114.51]RAH84602.1 ABC transporter-like protein [Aspergillus japonicus CBS 114.51]